MQPRTRLGFAALVLSLAAAPAIAKDRWLHIRVEETKDTPQIVRVNLPLSLLEGAAPLLESAQFEGSKIKVGNEDWDRARLKSLWQEVRLAEDGEYVTVESGTESVRVAKTGEFLTIKVRESRRRAEKVDVKIPLAVVDALLSGDGDTLNFVAAIKALKDRGDGELVAVNDESSVVRIWIDQKNGD